MDDDDPQTITAILESGDETPEVVARAVSAAYGEIRNIASRLLRGERRDHTLATTELVHEAYLRLFNLEHMRFVDRLHFFHTVAGTMRRILVDHERKRRAQKRIPPGALKPIDSAEPAPFFPPTVDLLALHDALERLEAVDPRRARF